jgi:hypothetical protein
VHRINMSVAKVIAITLIPSILSNLGFGIAALVLSQLATAADIAACSTPAQQWDTNYTGLLLGLGITYVVCGGICLIVMVVACISESVGGVLYLISRILLALAGITNFVLSIIGSVHTWQPGACVYFRWWLCWLSWLMRCGARLGVVRLPEHHAVVLEPCVLHRDLGGDRLCVHPVDGDAGLRPQEERVNTRAVVLLFRFYVVRFSSSVVLVAAVKTSKIYKEFA